MGWENELRGLNVLSQSLCLTAILKNLTETMFCRQSMQINHCSYAKFRSPPFHFCTTTNKPLYSDSFLAQFRAVGNFKIMAYD